MHYHRLTRGQINEIYRRGKREVTLNWSEDGLILYTLKLYPKVSNTKVFRVKCYRKINFTSRLLSDVPVLNVLTFEIQQIYA